MIIYNNIAVLIPALNPDKKLIRLVQELNQIGLVNTVVIDDGSNNETQSVFDELQNFGTHVIHHPSNQGKGAALITGIRWIKKNQPKIVGIVTADADGQHAPKDILKVAYTMLLDNCIVLGTRNLSKPEVPLTSKIGNTFSAIYFALKTGKIIKDTQTGLRGIPSRFFKLALNVEGDRYDYEMRFLEQMSAKGVCYVLVDIETIYEEDRVTHFNTVSDSLTIYKSFFKNIASSILSALVDIAGFMLFISFGNQIFFATVAARTISGIFNFSLNKIWVFKKRSSHNTRNEFFKYLSLFTTQMILSGLFTDSLSTLFQFQNGLLFSKIIVDCVLFIGSYLVQRFWIFPFNHYSYGQQNEEKTRL